MVAPLHAIALEQVLHHHRSLSPGAVWGDRLMSPPSSYQCFFSSHHSKRNSPEPESHLLYPVGLTMFPSDFFGNSSCCATTFFMRRIFRMKLPTEQENSYYFMRLGTTALSREGGCPCGGGKAPKNVSKKKNRRNSLH
jgi:hypothetical protein